MEPELPKAYRRATLVDLLDRVLDKGLSQILNEFFQFPSAQGVIGLDGMAADGLGNRVFA